MSEYIITANNTLIKLREGIDSFKQEAMLIDEAKCYLVNHKDLDDFEYYGTYVEETGRGYNLYYGDLVIRLEIEDNMITDYDFD